MQNLDMRVHDTGFSSGDSICPHCHAESGLHEFHYFLGGEGTFWNDGREYAADPGTIFYSQPTEVHRARTQEPGGRFRFYYLLFSVEDDRDDLTPALRERFASGAAASIGRGLAPVFEDIRNRQASRDPLVRRSADFRFQGLLCDLLGGRSGPEPAAGGYVSEALGLMQASVHSGLDLDDLSGRLGIDKSYFVRLFKRQVGVPPMRYFLGLRLDTAKHRLRNGDEGLRAIALDLGFHDEFHFSHQFKTHVGQSPQAFRQRVP